MRDPVVTMVDGLVTGGGVGFGGIHGSHCALEGITSDDGVDMGGGDAGLDDGV